MRDEAMEHREVLARLSDAALERDGIQRLLVSDRELAAHVGSCRSCTAERDAWLRAADALADALAPDVLPERAGSPVELPADLRDRTLRLVAERGIARPGPSPNAGSSPTVGTSATTGPSTAARPTGDAIGIAHLRRRRRRRMRQSLAAAAAVVVLLGGGGLVVDLARQRDQATQERDLARSEAQQLAGVTGTLDALLAEPGHRVASLASTATGEAVGSVVWGPTSSRLAVVTDALAAPPSGSTYRCWVERDGIRHVIGQMEFGEGLAYWVGWVDPASGIGLGSRIGVSLVAGPGGGAPPPVLLASF